VDWAQLIIDHPSLAILTVLPLVALGAVMKIGITLMTAPDDPVDARPSDEAPP